jgi:hypothetical protein
MASSFSDTDVTSKMFEKIIADDRLLAMGTPMKDVLKIMMAKSEMYKASEEVLAEFELDSNEPGDELLKLSLNNAPVEVEHHESGDILCDVGTYKAVLAEHSMCNSIRDKILSSAILSNFDHMVFVRAGVYY